MSNKIRKIELLNDYKIAIWLENEEKIIYDLGVRLNTIRFIELQDKQLFTSARVIKGKIIRWNHVTEITLDEILYEKERE